MESVLDLYGEKHDPRRPVVCFDEASKELHAHAKEPLPAQPGKVRREDYEYQRLGTVNLFLACCPRVGWRHVAVSSQRTYQDVARQFQALVDVHFPKAEKVRLVLDNLNTHTPAALYETFPADEAARILARLEFHYTPKHASWLNMAEMEWSVLTRQVLDQRFPDQASLKRAIAAWQKHRNKTAAPIRWCFSTTLARSKLAHLYPVQLS